MIQKTTIIFLIVIIFCITCISAAKKTKPIPVTCGSIIKLKHKNTKTRLHSHEVTYGTGSGQQSVTGFPGTDSNSYWIVKGKHGTECTPGTPIKHGDTIRLQHVNTGKHLHSHLHRSPLSRQQEVSCFGRGKEGGDTGDNWRIELVDGKSGDLWTTKKLVTLIHEDTNKYLHSHNHKFGHPIYNQHEVTCYHQQNSDNYWIATEGIYYPVE